MDKQYIIELQKIDCNCNDCRYMSRDIDKYKSYDSIYINKKGEITTPSFRVNYGKCNFFDKDVSFIPNTCQVETQNCFIHRRE